MRLPEYGRALPAFVVAFVLVATDGRTSGPTPSGWMGSDIGGPAAAGAANIEGDTVTIRGGGSDIWHFADQFYFLHQIVTGDVEIVAQVKDLSAADPWAKAGVMIRQSLASGSPHTSMLGTVGNGWVSEIRPSSDGWTNESSGPGGATPGWVRVVRTGDLLQAYHSDDGSTWSLVGSESIAMPAAVYVGLAVSGHDADGGTATATFRNVEIRAASSEQNQPPTVSIISPASGTGFSAPATITIAAVASDPDGTVDGVDFFAGSQLVGSAATSPYSFTLSDVPAGNYTLTAVARDDRGATGTSSSVVATVTVTATVTTPSSPTTRVVFDPSQDHATVTSYDVSLRLAGQPTSAAPMASLDIGKPSVVDGEISADISALVDALPSGSYLRRCQCNRTWRDLSELALSRVREVDHGVSQTRARLCQLWRGSTASSKRPTLSPLATPLSTRARTCRSWRVARSIWPAIVWPPSEPAIFRERLSAETGLNQMPGGAIAVSGLPFALTRGNDRLPRMGSGLGWGDRLRGSHAPSTLSALRQAG